MVLIFHFKCTLKCCLQFVSTRYPSKILSSGNGLKNVIILVYTNEPVAKHEINGIYEVYFNLSLKKKKN